jgi:pyruvate dehydrogenase E2 component (dihydrolipoamide acetyltransferase)
MARAFKLPDLGEGVHEGEVLSVHVRQGQQIAEGDLILTIETDKAAVEIPSPFSGKVARIMVAAGDIVNVGDVLMTFDATAEGPVDGATPAAAEVAQEKPPVRQVAEPSVETRRRGPVPASPATRRLARELGVDLNQVPPGSPNGLVTAEDVKAFAETRASTQEPEAPPPQKQQEAPAAAPSTPPKTAGPPEDTPAPALPDFSRWGAVERVPVRSIRRATARQMTLAWSQIPHVSSHDNANVTRLEQFRQKHKQAIAEQGGRLTLTVFALKAAATALKRFPDFNASLDLQTNEIVRKQYYHIGVAVDTEEGLVVPVIRDVDRKSIRELAVELDDCVQRARRRKISRDAMQGGTFTITNAGAMGGGHFTPLINFPEVAIMGLGQARLQPVVIAHENRAPAVVPQLVVPLVVCIDHRVLDGRDAIGFLKVVTRMLEDPDEMLIGMV